MRNIGNKIFTVVIGILLLCIGLTAGITISAAVVIGKAGVVLTILKVALALIFGMFISIISHEAGHMVCGLISGYRFSSFRILSLMIMKQDGKFVFRRFSIPGTGGQCLMTPPKGREFMPYRLYLYGGTIANMILAVICTLLCYLIGLDSFFSLILILTGAASLYLTFVNGLPREVGGMANDAMNVKLMRSDKNARRAMMIQLRINDAQTRGMRLSEMPEEWFSLPNDNNHRNTLCTSIKVFACNRLMDQERFAEADIEIRKLLSSRDNIVNIYRYFLRCDLIFCELILRGSEANISSLYTTQYKRIAKTMSFYPSFLRTEYAINTIRAKDKNAAEKTRQKFDRKTKNSPFTQDVKFESHLMDLAYEKAFGEQTTPEN